MSNITIHRCPHDQKNPYVMINNDLIRDASLSPECRWLLIYLLSNQDGWKISVNQLREHLKISKPKDKKYGTGRDKIYGMLNEAVEAGYMALEEYLVKGLKRTRYVVSETPKFKKCLPRPEIPDAENQEPVSLYIKNNQEYKNNQREREATPPARPSFFKITERAQHVFINETNHQKLVEEHGEEKTLEFYRILSEWKLDTPKSKWKKDDYRTILRWVIDAEAERRKKKTPASKSSVSSDAQLANKIWDKFKGTRNDIHLSGKYIEFINGVNAPSTVLEFGTPDFRNNCLKQLEKRTLKLDYQ
jgi:hypothetical protein